MSIPSIFIFDYYFIVFILFVFILLYCRVFAELSIISSDLLLILQRDSTTTMSNPNTFSLDSAISVFDGMSLEDNKVEENEIDNEDGDNNDDNDRVDNLTQLTSPSSHSPENLSFDIMHIQEEEDNDEDYNNFNEYNEYYDYENDERNFSTPLSQIYRREYFNDYYYQNQNNDENDENNNNL